MVQVQKSVSFPRIPLGPRCPRWPPNPCWVYIIWRILMRSCSWILLNSGRQIWASGQRLEPVAERLLWRASSLNLYAARSDITVERVPHQLDQRRSQTFINTVWVFWRLKKNNGAGVEEDIVPRQRMESGLKWAERDGAVCKRLITSSGSVMSFAECSVFKSFPAAEGCGLSRTFWEHKEEKTGSCGKF